MIEVHSPTMVAFELSNRCNFAHLHKECPANPNADPVFLSTDIIKNTIRYLGGVGYSGGIIFSIYNEPLIDPRFFMLVEFTRENCPTCGIQCFTNGWGLNQYMADELLKFGVVFSVSCYTDSEYARFEKLVNVPFARITLDPRVKTIYGCPPTRTGPCLFPSVYSFVNHKGHFVLCCRDYEYHVVIGDLAIYSFEEILVSEYRQEICDRLEAGDRFLDVCKRCPFPGWGVVNED